MRRRIPCRFCPPWADFHPCVHFHHAVCSKLPGKLLFIELPLKFSINSPIYKAKEKIMVRGIPNVSVPAIDYAMSHGSKMSLPVASSSLVYSFFEHVSGIPAPQGSQGVSISKLHLIDVLIEQINKINSNRVVPATMTAMPENSLDGLIENYKNQILAAKTASEAMPYLPSPSAPSGVLFSIVA